MDRFAKILLYGDQGCWKTVTALRYDNNARIYVTDDGWISALNHPEWIKISDLDIVSYEGRSQILAEDFTSNHTTYILDTFSEMVEQYLDLLMKEAKWGGNFREKIITNDKDLKGLEAPAMADYHVIRNQFRPVARQYLLSRKDIFFLAHENEPIKGLGDQAIRPDVPNKTFKAFARNCHVIGRMIRKQKGVLIDCDGIGSAVAKSRISTIKGLMSVDDFLTALKEWKVTTNV